MESSPESVASTWQRAKPFVVAVTIVAGFAAALVLAYVLLNPAAPAPRGRVPGATAPMSTVADVYLNAAKHEDCGLTRVLTTSHTTAWCDDPHLISYRLVARTGDDGQCMAYEITTTASADGSMDAGSRGWSFCFVQTKAGWRLWDQGQG